MTLLLISASRAEECPIFWHTHQGPTRYTQNYYKARKLKGFRFLRSTISRLCQISALNDAECSYMWLTKIAMIVSCVSQAVSHIIAVTMTTHVQPVTAQTMIW